MQEEAINSNDNNHGGDRGGSGGGVDEDPVVDDGGGDAAAAAGGGGGDFATSDRTATSTTTTTRRRNPYEDRSPEDKRESGGEGGGGEASTTEASQTNGGSRRKTADNDDGGEYSDEETRRRREILSRDNLQRLLADALSYKSKVSDLETIVRCGGDVNGAVQRGLLPLHYAVHAGNIDGIHFLLGKGADVNAADDIGYRPVHLCARRGLCESLQVLIENGAYVDFFLDQQDISEATKNLSYLAIEPLNMALENNQVECARMLLTHGARPDHHYFLGYEINLVPLENLDCLKLLLEFGADPNVFSRCGVTPLMKACRQHNIRAARILVEASADVDVQPPDRFEQKTAIHFAIESGSVGITTMLIRHDALMSRPPGYHYSALHTAVVHDKPEFCELILRWDASVDELTDESATALQLACATPNLKRRQETVDVLLRYGADVNAWSPFVSFSSPYLSPLTEYMRFSTDCIQHDIVYSLVTNGAKVSFRAASTSSRKRDPHGILHCVQYIKHRPDIFHLLVGVSNTFDPDSIHAYSCLSPDQKDVLMGVARSPRDLKTLVRISLRQRFTNRFIHIIPCLPLPQMVKDFLLSKF